MAKKPAPNGSVPSPSSPEISARPLGPLSVLADKEELRQREEDVTKINNMNASDLKNACDDALKRVSFCYVHRPTRSSRLRSLLRVMSMSGLKLISPSPTLLVPLPSRTISAELHPYGREACVRLVVRLRRLRNGIVWLEDRL